jgi:hypothetical protein
MKEPTEEPVPDQVLRVAKLHHAVIAGVTKGLLVGATMEGGRHEQRHDHRRRVASAKCDGALVETLAHFVKLYDSLVICTGPSGMQRLEEAPFIWRSQEVRRFRSLDFLYLAANCLEQLAKIGNGGTP